MLTTIENKKVRKSGNVRTVPVQWFGQVIISGHIADEIQAEANRRKISPPELIGRLLTAVANSNLYKAVIDL